MSGGAGYKKMTEVWGRARTSFIRSQMAKGRTRTQAIENWNKTRKELKEQNINYPPTSLYDGNMSTMTDEEQADYRRRERLHKAQQQKEEFQNRERDERARRRGGNLDEQDPQLPGGSNNDTPRAQAPEEVETPSGQEVNFENADFQLITDAEQAELDELLGTHTIPNRANDLDEMGGRGQAQPPAELPAPGARRPAADSVSGDSPGENENMGKGGGGGGLAGAGNNQFFHGFAKSTIPRDPEDYTYVDTYRRPFQVHTQFPDPYDVQAKITTRPVPWIDEPTGSGLGYNGQFNIGEVTSSAIYIPYWVREASMKTHDWNKPADHVAYQVVEYGFDCPNMRLNILNNTKETPEDVAPAPPADARMWTFVDIHNDYGIPVPQDPAKVQHNQYFTLEDMLSENVADYSLPQLGTRYLALDTAVAATIGQSRHWYVSGDKSQYLTGDHNNLYDMKRHPGYKEFILSEASFGASYKPNSPIVRLPMPAMQSLDMGVRQSGTGAMDPENGVFSLSTWQNVNKQDYLESLGRPEPTLPIQTTNRGQTNYYILNQSALFNDQRDSEEASASWQAGIDQYSDKQVRPPGNAAIIGQGPLAKVRTMGRSDVSDDGKHFSKCLCDRPPLFLIGIYKELEYRTTPKFWRYYMYGQVNYWCKIKWFVQPNRTKVYLPIGLGGVYTTGSYDLVNSKETRKTMLEDKYKYRYTMKPLLNSTAYEKAATPRNSNGGPVL
uniref:Capsid protein n=1 Tax=Parvoviridae sp. TaxID=1940570 RepID=A0A7D3UW59_9VIRU|nr:MAG: hypothetical protein [Parvoviridae sp.]